MMNDDIIIRKAESGDFEIIYEFICALEDIQFDKTILKNLFSRNINDENNIYIVAVHKDQTGGYLSCHGQYLLHHGGFIGEIQEMFVLPEKRNMGLGKRLFHELRRVAKQKEMLQLEVTAHHMRREAHQFYLKEGFVLTHKKFVSTLTP